MQNEELPNSEYKKICLVLMVVTVLVVGRHDMELTDTIRRAGGLCDTFVVYSTT